MRRSLIVLLALSGLVVAAPAAFGSDGARQSDSDDTKSIALSIKTVKASTGQFRFTIVPTGFTYTKVPYAGSKNVAGQGHAHIYAIADGTKKRVYIGWTGTGATSWTDKGMLESGTTYRVFAIFSENDHTEDRTIMSNWRKVVVS